MSEHENQSEFLERGAGPGIEIRDAHFPGRAPVDTYGNGGFRFADMSHKGSLLCLPSGIYGWDPVEVADLTLDRFSRALAERDNLELLLLGTGPDLALPSQGVREAFQKAGIRLEIMSTGAAARTFNVLLSEGRAVGVALLAVA